MKSIIQDIYYSRLDPASHIISQDPEYSRLWERAAQERDYLTLCLSPTDAPHLEALEELISDAFSMDICAGYVYGLRQGARLYRELMEPQHSNQ